MAEDSRAAGRSALIFTRDARTLPYVPVTGAALRAIAERVPSKRLVYARSLYLALLEFANEERGAAAAVSRKALAERAGCSRELISDLTPMLVGAGVVEVHERVHGAQRLENEWVIVEPPDRTPVPGRQHPLPGGHGGAAPEAQRSLEGGEESHRPSSSEPLELDLDDGLPQELARDAAELLKAKRKVGRRVVTPAEMGVAAAALAEFNRQAGSSYGLGASLPMLVERIRERPSWDAGAHVRLVRSAFVRPWWTRDGSTKRPTPAVIYGPRAFERVVQEAAEQARTGDPDRWVRHKPVQDW